MNKSIFSTFTSVVINGKIIKNTKEVNFMIGLGKWTGEIETSLISGSAIVEISDNNGEYDFSVTVPSLKKLPKFKVYDIKEDGNRLSGKAEIELMGKMNVNISVEINGDAFTGYLQVPVLGKIEIKNGKKIG